MKDKLEKVFQVGLVVNDVASFVNRYEKDFGIGPWEVVDFTPELLPGMVVEGAPADLRMKIAFCRAYGTELELIQPISESIYMDWLRQHGPGIHHMAFVQHDYEGIMSGLAGMGKKPLMEVSDGSGSRGFAYVDLMKELGFILELHKGLPG
jgi:methylmalonyl-CoA/ethylmalonyl-CoA epimerase